MKVDLLPSEDPSHVKSIAIIGPSISWVDQCIYARQSSSLPDDSGYATCGESLDSTGQNAVKRPAYLDQGLAWISQRPVWIRYLAISLNQYLTHTISISDTVAWVIQVRNCFRDCLFRFDWFAIAIATQEAVAYLADRFSRCEVVLEHALSLATHFKSTVEDSLPWWMCTSSFSDQKGFVIGHWHRRS